MNLMINKKAIRLPKNLSEHNQKSKMFGRVKCQLQLLLAITSLTLIVGNQVMAASKDDPLLTMFTIDQLEIRDSDEDNPLVLEGQFWVGYDLEKLWIKTELERVGGETEEAELQFLYSKAIAPYWDLQMGWRRDFQLGDNDKPERDWAVFGVQGLAPYYFEVDTAFFISDSGRTALRFEAEYELLFTQQWILTPEFEVNFYGQNDRETGTGSGLSDVEFGLRLRYEVRREFAPYIGINWSKKYGNTAEYSRLQGESSSDTQIVLGLRAWF